MGGRAKLDLVINGIDLGRGRGGNEAYLRGLIGALRERPEVRQLSVIVATHYLGIENKLKEEWPNVNLVNVGKYLRFPYLLWQQTLALRRVPCDWFLSTYFLPPIAPKQSAIFVHDLSFYSLPRAYPRLVQVYMQVLTTWAMVRAQHIVVLSHFVHDELRRFHPQLARRAHVIYPGVRSDFTPLPSSLDKEVLRRYQLAPGYVLSVSSIHPRKNTSSLIQAYQLLRAQMGEATPPLVLVGQRYWGSEVLDQVADMKCIRWLGYVPDEDLPALYRHAGVFVYPSLYEGFGLPPVEAMACGTPTICGKYSSLPEAVEDGALLVDVRAPEAIAVAMRQLLEQGELRAVLTERGLRRARELTWTRTADQLMRLLQSEGLF